MNDFPGLTISTHDDRAAMGKRAALHVHGVVSRAVEAAGRARVIFACAPSQDDFYRSLVNEVRKDPAPWRKVEVFHMDEYVGLKETDPQSFRFYLRRHFLDHVEVGAVELMEAEAVDVQTEAARYARLLAAAPIDLICLGIGENGHIAFNDPAVANFNDRSLVKLVELDQACRNQQVNDGCFASLDQVPNFAFTITVPVFAMAKTLSCVVPTKRKAAAVRNALTQPIGPACPATFLRQHPSATLFLDREAASLLPPDLLAAKALD